MRICSGSLRSPRCASAHMPFCPAKRSRTCWRAMAWRWPDRIRKAPPPRNFAQGGHSVAMGAAYISQGVTEARTMSAQERALVTELFDRLATLENNPRDGEAERAIIDGLRRAP